MKIKNLLYLLLLLALGVNLHAQKISINGIVQSSEGVKLTGAAVVLANETGTSTNKEGLFFLKTDKQNSYQISVSMLGFKTLDTMVVAVGGDNIFLELTLEQNIFEQPEIIVRPDEITLFDRNDWTILDYDIFDHQLVVLSIRGRKRKLQLYTMQGYLLSELDVDRQFNEIHISCTNRVHLVGKTEGLEIITNDNNRLTKKSTYDINQFHTLIEPCLFKHNGDFVFKSHSRHNKRVHVFKYLKDTKPTKQELIHELYDKQAAQTAQSYYREIIGLYYQAIESPEVGSTTEGFALDNTIRLREWSGNLTELAVTNELVMAISYYRNVEARPIFYAVFLQDDNVVVMDVLEKGFMVFDKKGKQKFRKVKDLDWKSEYKVVTDAITNKNYLIDDKDNVYLFSNTKKKCTLDVVGQLPKEGTYKRMARVEDGVFYYVTQPSGTSAVSILRRFTLESD
ncbi:MAG: carboxypeptidase-like regulatory domain-containing protein [Saprospiraceae bacterium]